jgi:hypothetical protein
MIRFFGVGRSTVVQGSLLRVLAIIESAARETAPGPHLKAVLHLMGEHSKRQFDLSFQTELEDRPGVKIASFVGEFETEHLEIGAYEVYLTVHQEREEQTRVAAHEDRVRLDELVWILTSVQYQELLTAEISLPSTESILPESAPDPARAQQLVGVAMSEKLSGFLRLGTRLVYAPPIDFSVNQMPRLSLDLIAYLAEVFADECRNVLLHGARDCHIGVAFDDFSFRFAMRAGLDNVANVRAGTLENRDWPSLKAALNSASEELELTFATKVLEGVATSSVEMRRLQYAVA